ncbi:MAG: hypothetical protein ACPK85_07030 [Methanosarcina sp.]
MKCQKRCSSEGKKEHLVPASCSLSCRSEFTHSSGKSYFNYSIMKSNLLSYKLDSNPVWTEYTFSTPVEFPAKQNITMKYSDIYPDCAAKYFETQGF